MFQVGPQGYPIVRKRLLRIFTRDPEFFVSLQSVHIFNQEKILKRARPTYWNRGFSTEPHQRKLDRLIVI